jgi:hypothetical protein
MSTSEAVDAALAQYKAPNGTSAVERTCRSAAHDARKLAIIAAPTIGGPA